MNKRQLIEALSSHYEGNRKAARHALESVLDTITREVARGEKVAISGFGAFEKAVRPARMVRNPRTGERKPAEKTAVPRFKAGADLKAVVSGARNLPAVAVSTAARAAAAAGSVATGRSTGESASDASTSTSTAKKASTPKKAPAKKAPAKQVPAKKAPSKKAPAKKASTSASTAKKAGTAKKTSTAKKASTAKNASTAKKASPAKKSSTSQDG